MSKRYLMDQKGKLIPIKVEEKKEENKNLPKGNGVGSGSGYVNLSRRERHKLELENKKTEQDENLLSKKIKNFEDIESFSVIIPAYKCKKFIEDCVKSIIENQFSVKNYEILIGIDKCRETYEFIKNNELIKSNCKIFYFHENVGPYIIRNTLAQKSKYDNIIFFDADDIMIEGQIEKTLINLNYDDIVRWKFFDFENSTEISRKNYMHAQGAFAIKKKPFLELRGFIPWKISADWEFNLRSEFYKKTTNLSDIHFFRRVHEENLTRRKDTGMKSPERIRINEIITEKKQKGNFPNPEKLHIGFPTEIDFSFDINEYFDKIWCLNLDRRPDKFEKISERFNRLNIKTERFPAIDGKDLNIEDFDLTKYQTANKNGIVYEIACCKSHSEIIKKSKELGSKRIIVFEDDVLFSDEFDIYIQRINKIEDWKVFYLGSSQYDWRVEMYEENFFFAKKTDGFFAYCLDESVFDECIEILNRFEQPADTSITKIQENHYGKCFSFYPSICCADVSSSDIRGERNQTEHSKRMRWTLNYE